MNGETRRSKKTKQVLRAMHILAWLAFVGFMIEAGAVLTTYIVSLINPAAVKNMYKDLNLQQLQAYSLQHYTLVVLGMVALLGLKAYVSMLAIRVMLAVNLATPFTVRIARLLQKISFMLAAVAFIALLSQVHNDWLLETIGLQQAEQPIGEFIFTAGLVFIISQVFRRGVELQLEKELTV